jgi:hypothetical protein
MSYWLVMNLTKSYLCRVNNLDLIHTSVSRGRKNGFVEDALIRAYGWPTNHNRDLHTEVPISQIGLRGSRGACPVTSLVRHSGTSVHQAQMIYGTKAATCRE